MTAREKLTTVVLAEGKVILPKSVRDQKRWPTGTRLIVEDVPDGILLKAEPLFAPTRPEDVFGSLKAKGRPKTLQEMDAGIAAEVKRRHDRSRH